MSECERVNQSEAHFQSLPGHTSVHVTYLNYVSIFLCVIVFTSDKCIQRCKFNYWMMIIHICIASVRKSLDDVSQTDCMKPVVFRAYMYVDVLCVHIE